jgi:hypothetical protein
MTDPSPPSIRDAQALDPGHTEAAKARLAALLPNAPRWYTIPKEVLRDLPEAMHDAVLMYVERGRLSAGSFLSAVVRNDLLDAVRRADPINVLRLKEWATFFYLHVPAGAWGSREKVDRWIEHGGMHGLVERFGPDRAAMIAGGQQHPTP